jgi:hypothetical protein
MGKTFTTAQEAVIQQAINLMLLTSATELPFDERIIETVAPVAAAVGFIPPGHTQATTGAFLEAAKLNPISTLLSFVAFVGHP